MTRLMMSCVFSLASLLCAHSFLDAQSIRTATVRLRDYPGPLLIIGVDVDGHGPYDFVVDTGSTTSILDNALSRELGLRREEYAVLTRPSLSQRHGRKVRR
jgi:Aspartyl protease